MKKLALFVCLTAITATAGHSQSLSRVTSGLDIGTAYQDKEWAPAATYHQELSLSNFPWFRLGWGLRAWGYYAGRSDLLPRNHALSGDTLKFGKVSANGLSFLLGANIRIWRIDLGANTDLVGVAFGARRGGLYAKTDLFEGEGAPYYNRHVPSNPSAFNVLPVLIDRQNGQSELYLRYWITDRFGIKLGYTFGRVTYSTNVALDNGQRRFSKTYGMPFAALSFPLYN